MDWSCLGHATWLVEAAGLRLLFDPVLGATHHGGVFEVVGRGAALAEALRPDFVLVSHRHPDHFDVPSLRRLIALDPELVLVTPDPLVAWAAAELGARAVRTVGAGQRIELDGVSLVTTPSLARDEWGALVATREGTVWNQVDTVLAGPEEVRRVAAESLAALGAAELSLALVRWQPMLEVAAQLGRRTAFPYREYATLLAEAAATGARAVVPSAAGEAYTAAWSAMNSVVFPVGEDRFLRDLAALSPATRGLPCRPGARYRVRAGEVALEPAGASEYVTAPAREDPRRYAPFELSPVADPGLAEVEVAVQKADIEAWLRGPLARGLARAWSKGPPLRLQLEVRYPAEVEVFTLRVQGDAVALTRGAEPDWDALNVVAGSLLWEVLQGRKHWGDPLLAGALRGCTRAYELRGAALRPLPLADVFLYYGLSYDESVRQSVEYQVALHRPA